MKPFNVQNFKRLMKSLEDADNSGSPDDFFVLIGFITTTFETCEYYLHLVLRPMDKGNKVLPLIFNAVSSRSVRAQMLREFIEGARPNRHLRGYDRIAKAFEDYCSVGKQRDEVAHCALVHWNLNGDEKYILEPPAHIEKKREAAMPKYHYDIPKLEKVAADLQALAHGLIAILAEQGELNARRLRKLAPLA